MADILPSIYLSLKCFLCMDFFTRCINFGVYAHVFWVKEFNKSIILVLELQFIHTYWGTGTHNPKWPTLFCQLTNFFLFIDYFTRCIKFGVYTHVFWVKEFNENTIFLFP